METIAQCPSCESTDLKHLRELVFRSPGNDIRNHLLEVTYERLWILFERILRDRKEARFRAVLCQGCGLIFTNPRFTEADFKIKYQTIIELGSVKQRYEKKPPSNLDVRANRIFRLIKEHLNVQGRKPSILDYGGASGYILRPFAGSFDCGILDYEKWDLPNGINYLGRDLADLQPDAKFDVILLLHTLEHVLKPAELINALVSTLTEKGILHVEVPLGCFYEWSHLAEPMTHINFFSEESLFNCFKRCGLTTIQLSTAYQWTMHSRQWCLNIIGSKSPLAGRITRTPLPTRTQMSKLAYYLPPIRRRLRKLVGLPNVP